jgi:hypothetical protein
LNQHGFANLKSCLQRNFLVLFPGVSIFLLRSMGDRPLSRPSRENRSSAEAASSAAFAPALGS